MQARRGDSTHYALKRIVLPFLLNWADCFGALRRLVLKRVIPIGTTVCRGLRSATISRWTVALPQGITNWQSLAKFRMCDGLVLRG